MSEDRAHEQLLARIAELEGERDALAERVTELQSSKQHLQAILDNTKQPIFLKAADGNYILINPIFGHLARTHVDKIAGKNDYDLFPEPIAELFSHQDEETLRVGAQVDFQETVELPDGTFTFITSKFPVRDEEGKITAVGGVCTDITELKAAEEALRLSEEKFKSIIENSPFGIHIYELGSDDQLVFAGANPAASEILGVDCTQFIGKPIEEAFPPLSETEIPGRYRKVCRDGEPWSTEFVEYSAGDISGAFEVSAFQTGPGVAAVFFVDATVRRQMEKELLKVQKLESVGVFAGGIAHDFNNVLAAILGNISLARHHLDGSNDKVREVLHAAESASMVAKGLTQQLLTFSSGGAPVRRLASVSEVVRESAMFALHGSNSICEFSLPDDLWPVEVDTGQMSQVIQNVVMNADQAMPDGGTVRAIAENVVNDGALVPTMPAGRLVRILIRDQGEGIPDHLLDKIFDPYFTTKQKGSGLGLAVSHSIIKQHDGAIRATSVLGEGTTFEILLVASVKGEIALADDSADQRPVRSARVLVVDDDAMVRDVVANMASCLGCEVLQAKDGAEAIKIYGRHLNSSKAVDIVLMDLTIPGGMGGREAVDGLLALDPNAYVVVSSGYSTDPVMAEFREYGFRDAIVKPYNFDELSNLLSAFTRDDQPASSLEA